MRGGVEREGECCAGEIVRCGEQRINFLDLCDLYGGVEGKGHTRRMRCFENPVRVFRIGDDLVSPFYLEMAAGLFE